MLVKNTGSESDILLTAACDIANMVEVMNTHMEGDVMSMGEVEGIEIPAGASVELRSGSYHIMLMDLKENLTAGGTVSVTLVFEKAGAIVVEVPVTAP
jgi:copper(I)-binding protein